MSDKEAAINAVSQLPETATYEQITQELSRLAAARQGSAETQQETSSSDGGHPNSVWPSKF